MTAAHATELNSMSTTTIRLPEELKARVASAASRSGTTSHGFILDAIAEKVTQAERQHDFAEQGEQRYAALLKSGKTIAWPQMRKYLEDRLAGKKTAKPVPRKLAR
jgi:predicted transcriptional regulator